MRLGVILGLVELRAIGGSHETGNDCWSHVIKGDPRSHEITLMLYPMRSRAILGPMRLGAIQGPMKSGIIPSSLRLGVNPGSSEMEGDLGSRRVTQSHTLDAILQIGKPRTEMTGQSCCLGMSEPYLSWL